MWKPLFFFFYFAMFGSFSGRAAAAFHLRSWVALPHTARGSPPSSLHYRNDPTTEQDGVQEYDALLRKVPFFFVSHGVDDDDAKLQLSLVAARSRSVKEVKASSSLPTSAATDAPTWPRRSSRSHPQRMAVFEGGEPFFSLSNIEYGVAPARIANAAVTGAALAAGVLCSSVLATLTDPYSPTTSLLDLDVAASSSWLLAVPLVTAYLSITRSTVGGLTRTVSDSFMNLLRLGHLLGSAAFEISVDTIQAIAAADDATAADHSLPTLGGALLWYGARAVGQHAVQSLRRTEQTAQQAVAQVLQQQVERTRRERMQRQERRQRALLQAQLYYARNQKEEAAVEQDDDETTDWIVSARSKEAAQRQLEQGARPTTVVVPSMPIFTLGPAERSVLPERIAALSPQHLFFLGDEEREVVAPPTRTVLASVSLATERPTEDLPEMVLTEAGDVFSPPQGRVFFLGEDERAHLRVENASWPFGEAWSPHDDDDLVPKASAVLVPLDAAPVPPVFWLGDEEREAVPTAPFLVGQATDAGATKSNAESSRWQSTPVFRLGDEERAVREPVTGSVLPLPARNEYSVWQDVDKVEDVEQEKRAIAEARRLIQERAIALGKERLSKVLSGGVRWKKKNRAQELKQQNAVVSSHAMSQVCSESLARRSYRIQQFIARNRRYGTLFSDQSLVERGAMYLLAVTTPTLFQCWIQEAVTEYVLEDAAH
jgi:hypothetical protein